LQIKNSKFSPRESIRKLITILDDDLKLKDGKIEVKIGNDDDGCEIEE